MSLFTKTPPDSPGWFWWRGDDYVTDPAGWEVVNVFRCSRDQTLLMARCQEEDAYPLCGEFGPRCELPIAAPVECYGLMLADGTVSAEAANRPEVYDAARKVFPGSKVVRGQFIPLSIEEPT